MADPAPPRPPHPHPGRAAPLRRVQRPSVDLTPIASSGVLGMVPAGTLTDSPSNVPAYSCLNGAARDVYDNVNGKAMAEAVMPTDCRAQDFQLP